MSEWLKEHAWKAKRVSHTKEHRNSSSRNRFSDLRLSMLVDVTPETTVVVAGFAATLHSFYTVSGCTSGTAGTCEHAVVSSMLSEGQPAMSRVNVEIELPDTLATQAKKAGLLEPEALERMVREALLARRVEGLVEARDVLAANPLPPMTSEEIQAEIDAYRAEVRRAARP
jgi:hypothetical protein